MPGRPTPTRSSSSRGASSGRPGSGAYRGQSRRPSGSSRPASPPVKSDLEIALDAAADAAAATPDVATTFAALGLPERLVIALARRGMEAPFARKC